MPMENWLSPVPLCRNGRDTRTVHVPARSKHVPYTRKLFIEVETYARSQMANAHSSTLHKTTICALGMHWFAGYAPKKLHPNWTESAKGASSNSAISLERHFPIALSITQWNDMICSESMISTRLNWHYFGIRRVMCAECIWNMRTLRAWLKCFTYSSGIWLKQ